MVEGPDGIINKKKIHTYIYDRYNGVLCRYSRDVDSEFYQMKAALIEFQLKMIQDLDDDIIKYHLINFQLEKFS